MYITCLESVSIFFLYNYNKLEFIKTDNPNPTTAIIKLPPTVLAPLPTITGIINNGPHWQIAVLLVSIKVRFLAAHWAWISAHVWPGGRVGVVGRGVVGVGVGRGIVVVLRVGVGIVGAVVLAKTVGNEREGTLIDRSEPGVFVLFAAPHNNYCNIHLE